MKTPVLPLIGLAATLAIGLVQCAWGGVLPPEEFDYPFEGRLIVQGGKTQAEMTELCKYPFTGPAMGCARVRQDFKICYVFMAPDEVIKARGHDPELVLRHEIGHCNGWPSDHPRMR